MPDRRWDEETRTRLTEIARGYRMFQRKTAWFLRGFVVLFFASALVFTVLVGRVSDLADENAQVVKQIQDERANNIRSSCQDQNTRHDDTVAALDKLADRDLKQADTPAEKVRAQQTIDGTKALVDALAPKGDCEQRVRELVDTAR